MHIGRALVGVFVGFVAVLFAWMPVVGGLLAMLSLGILLSIQTKGV